MTDSTDKMVFVRPHAGLCNRLRVVVSSLIFACETGSRLKLHWVPGDGCWCAYEDLFEPHPDIETTPVRTKYLPPKIGKEIDWLVRQMPRHVHGGALALRYGVPFPYKTITRTDIERADFSLNTAIMAQHSLIIFRNVMSFMPEGWTSSRYQDAVSKILLSLTPSTSVREKLFDLPPNTIGIHARRGDHSRSRAISTDDAFRNEISRRLRDRPEASLFVASDDPAFIDDIKHIYPERVITRHVTERERHHQTGMQEALADLLMLSNCSELIGSALSSFSEYAAAFRQIPLHQVGTSNRS